MGFIFIMEDICSKSTKETYEYIQLNVDNILKNIYTY